VATSESCFFLSFFLPLTCGIAFLSDTLLM
jgi:hypothetical protein